MQGHRRFVTYFWLLLFLSSFISAQAQSYTYPFDNGRAELPAIIRSKHRPIQATYTLHNPTGKSVDVVLFQEMDEIEIYRLEAGKRTLLGRAGWIYPACLLQFDQYPEFGVEHRTGFLFQLPPHQTTHIQVVYRNKTFSEPATLRPMLFSRAAYHQFLDHRVSNHMQTRLLAMIFVGCLLIMFLYTSMQYVILRERILLYYALYVLLVILRSLVNDNYLQAMDSWPVLRSVGFVSRFSLTFLYWSLAAYGLFMCEYIQLRVRSSRYNRIYLTIIGFFILLGVGDVFISVDKYVVPAWQFVHRVTDISLLVFGLYTLHTLWRFYDSVTRYLFWGIVFFFLSGIASVINRMFFGDNPLAHDIEIIIFATGYLLEILTFALGIAQRHELTRQEKLRIQAQLIEQLQENERKQARLNGLRDEIARDLHDEMGSQLSSISILSQTTARYVSDERAHHRLATIGQTARQVMESMREIVWSLNSSSDTLQNIGLRIQETASTLLANSPAQLHSRFAQPDEVTSLTEKQRRELHLIAKECLTNCLRHSGARNIWLSLQINTDGLLFIVRDDGVGFDQATETSGLGLRNIRLRAGQMGATLSIESEPDMGTTIRLHCPAVPVLTRHSVTQPEDVPLQSVT